MRGTIPRKGRDDTRRKKKLLAAKVRLVVYYKNQKEHLQAAS